MMLGFKTTAQVDRTPKVVDSVELGRLNAVKKAHQMTDLPIYPILTLQANKHKTYEAKKNARGLIYSSTREINNFVGQDVSFHTFMTALHNPRSLLYSEKIDMPPYHGSNCRAYYGTVCSSLVTYALGLKITQRSADIPVADYMELINDQSATGICVADVLWRDGHVALITDVEKKRGGSIGRIEYCEAVKSGCRRRVLESGEEFNKMISQRKMRIYRYKYLYQNTTYTPVCEFVAVEGEKLAPFVYNDDICANKGDKSCYVTGEIVILNVAKGYDVVEIFKDSKLYKTISIGKQLDIILKDLPYGDYRARVVNGEKKSDYTYWKVIDVNVRIDNKNCIIYFGSSNAKPVYYEFCNISGDRPTNKNRIYAAELTGKDIQSGYVRVKAPRKPTKDKKGCPYVKIHFGCEYGRVINKPINWFE